MSLIFTTRFWLTWRQTTSALKMKMEHSSVSSANSPNRCREREWHEEQGSPPPPSTHLSIHHSLPYIPPSAKERASEREGERSSRKSFVHEHYSMTWIVVLLCEQLACLLCALMPDSHSKDPVAAARGFHSSIMRPDNSQNTLCLVQHAKLCVMVSANALLCTPIRTSSMHTRQSGP